MKFKVDVEVAGRTITKTYYADTLSELSTQIFKEFPKGKITSIVGG